MVQDRYKLLKARGLEPFFGENDGIGYKNPSAVKLFILQY